MIRHWAVVLLLTAATTCSAQRDKPSKASPRGSRPSMSLALTIPTNDRVYQMSDVVPLEAQLTNTGSDTLYLYDDVCWNPGNFLTVHVFALDGKEASGKLEYLRDCLPPPPRRNDISRFFRLEPNTFYGVIENFTVRELVPGPGDYEVVVRYEAALSAEWIAKYGGDKINELPVWTRDQPLLTSNRLRVSIKP